MYCHGKCVLPAGLRRVGRDFLDMVHARWASNVMLSQFHLGLSPHLPPTIPSHYLLDSLVLEKTLSGAARFASICMGSLTRTIPSELEFQLALATSETIIQMLTKIVSYGRLIRSELNAWNHALSILLGSLYDASAQHVGQASCKHRSCYHLQPSHKEMIEW